MESHILTSLMQDIESPDVADGMKITGLSPYWLDVVQGSAVQNTVDMQSLFLLTGPNGGGKSSLLRSICAAALLGICGLMVPAESALIPYFDSIMLHMKSYDSPAAGKSSFQVHYVSYIADLIVNFFTYSFTFWGKCPTCTGRWEN